jgi:uncharacterized SAM-binding protein YcdF (DUF218 family)
MIVMGTNDLGNARYAAKLALQYDYQFIVTSGQPAPVQSIYGEPFGKSEADAYADILEEAGIPKHKVFRERGATNTGENVTLTRALLGPERCCMIKTGLLIHKPYMERRALGTAEKQWPEVKWSVSSDPASYEAYIKKADEAYIIEKIVGDTYRLLDYCEKGFMTRHEMSSDIRKNLHILIKAGFNRKLPLDYTEKHFNME